MKLKEINRTASIAWSPVQSCPAIAAGTLSGAVDGTFSTTSELEIFNLDWSNRSNDELKPSGVVTSNSKFNRLAWSQPIGDHKLGVIAGGMENGELDLWNPEKILAGATTEESLISRLTLHSANVKGLDFNPFSSNLLASGATKGEILFWDLNNLSKTGAPETKSSKLGDITCLSWNNQVAHILAASSTSGYTVVWDEKNKREVMSLDGQVANSFNGAGGRRSVTAVAWNPDKATQLVTASDDDSNPVIMLWDLRNANAPEKVLTGHSKSILSLAWCRMDSDLLLSCGKDNRTVCWNPTSGQIVGEFPQSSNWSVDVQWSPRNPNLLSSTSYDGKIAIYSLLAGGESIEEAPKNNDDPFEVVKEKATPISLKHPPKWFRRPVGATFGFGGKLVHFNSAQGKEKQVTISSVVSDSSLFERSKKLERALTKNSIKSYCEEKVAEAQPGDEKTSWDVLRLLFEEDSRAQLVKMIGVERSVSSEDIAHVVEGLGLKLDSIESSPEAVTKESPEVTENKDTVEDSTQPEVTSPVKEGEDSTKEDEFTLLYKAGEESKKTDDFFDNVGEQSSAKDVVPPKAPLKPFHIGINNTSMEGLLSKMVVTGDFKGGVDLCLRSSRYADALILALCGDTELLAKTRKKIFEKRREEASYIRLLENVIEGNFMDVVLSADLSEWDKIITMICTYAEGEAFSQLVEALGQRLYHDSERPDSRQNSLMCFILAGNVEKVLRIWVADHMAKQGLSDSTDFDLETINSLRQDVLQDLIEKVSIFCKAIDFKEPEDKTYDETQAVDPKLAILYSLYYNYSSFMASQGRLEIAAKYISQIPVSFRKPSASSLDEYAALKNRLYHAGIDVTTFDPSNFPFTIEEIGPVALTYDQTQVSYQPQTNQYQQSNQIGFEGLYGNYQQQTPYQQQAVPDTQTAYNAQPTYHNGSYQAYQQPSAQAYNPMPSYQTGSSDQTLTSLYNPYPNYPPNNTAVPPFANNTLASQPPTGEQVLPHSSKKGGPAWNDPPAEVFASKKPPSKQGSKSRPQAVTSPFAMSSTGTPPPANYSGDQSSYPATGPVAHSLPPPPQGGRAPAPLYTRTTPPVQPQQLPRQTEAFPHQQGQQQAHSHPPQQAQQQAHGQPPRQGYNAPGQHPQPNQPYRPGQMPVPQQQQQQQQRPPQQHQQPPQRPHYQTQPGAPIPAPATASQFSNVGPPTPHPVAGRAPVPQQPRPPVVQSPPHKAQPILMDRSKMPPNLKPLYELLSAPLTALKKANLPPPQNRVLTDVDKKLNLLFDKMNSNELPAPLIDPLTQFGKALQARDFNQALALQNSILTTHVNHVGTWIAALKHLTNLLRGLN